MSPLEAVFTLAALSKKDLSDDELVRRYRIVAAGFGIEIRRQYLVSDRPSARHVTSQEVVELLRTPLPMASQPVELFANLVDLPTVLIALSDPNTKIIERAAKLANVTTDVVNQQLLAMGLDARARTFGGTPWTELPIKNAWSEFVVVEKVKDPYGEMPLRDAGWNTRILERSRIAAAKAALPGGPWCSLRGC